MKYLRIWPFRLSIVTFIESCHFKKLKRAKHWYSELCASTFPTFFGLVLGSYCRKRHDVTVTWPFENIFHRTNTVKINTDIINKDNGMLWSCMCSLIEILWVLEEKISLNCWQLQHDGPVTEIFEFNLPVNFLYFLSNWVNLLGICTTCEKLWAFERNPSLWSSYLMPWRQIVYV